MNTQTNNGVIFRRALRDSRSAVFWWGVVGAGMALLIVLIFPSMEAELGMYSEMIQSPIVQGLLGDIPDITSAAGFVSAEFFSWMPVVFSIYAVVAGLAIVSGEEMRGTLDILLSVPIPRWRVVAEKFAALVLGLLGILAVTLVGFLIGLVLVPQLDIPPLMLVAAVFNMLPLLLVTAAMTLLLTTALRSRGRAMGLVVAIMVASYFISTLAGLATEALSTVKYLSYWHYYDGYGPLFEGIQWGDFALLLVVAAVMFAASVWFFERRDLAV